MKNLIRKIIVVAFVLCSCLMTTSCSVKLVSWQDHKDAVELREQEYKLAYANVYASEYQKAVAEGRIKTDKDISDSTIDIVKDKLKSIIGGNELKKIEKKAESTAEKISKEKVPSTFFWSWLFIHVLVSLILLAGIVGAAIGITEDDSISLFTVIGGLALYVIQFITQNNLYNTHILLLQLLILAFVMVIYSLALGVETEVRKTFFSLGAFIHVIVILFLNKYTSLFAYPMLISASVWTLFISEIIIHKKNNDSKSGFSNFLIGIAVLVMAFIYSEISNLTYVTLISVFVVSVFRICIAKYENKFLSILFTLTVAAPIVTNIVTGDLLLPLYILGGMIVVEIIISKVVKVKADKEAAEAARLKAIEEKKKAEEERIAEEKKAAAEAAAKAKAEAEQKAAREKAEAERKAALEKAEAERKALEAAERARKEAEEKARREAEEARRAAEEARKAEVKKQYDSACSEASELEAKIATISGKDAVSILEKSKLVKQLKSINEKIDELKGQL